MDFESTGIGAAAGVVVTAVSGALVKLLGTRSERADDRAAATAEWRELAAEARAERESCEERARRTEADLDTLRETVAELEISHAKLKAEHARCPERIAALESLIVAGQMKEAGAE